ncbi:hypothetical protein Clocel_3577 [Clostridium cellulovorans 743B]|jgi:hypothetical protein|uniref:Lipoprotein n=1 Tax=Clostridium cellulovorans (strain ATCC 35296 / DSM 3052 / OCM 3 / 743B) TaxID=573061 RepID=D9SWH0_CLOC7|nr:hypothetical protein Clocel_3577 [Clostridium cellulovorans 743B]
MKNKDNWILNLFMFVGCFLTLVAVALAATGGVL